MITCTGSGSRKGTERKVGPNDSIQRITRARILYSSRDRSCSDTDWYED